MNIRETIVQKRRERIAREGHSLGAVVPEKRQYPLVAFDRPPFLICEIKKASPSRGDIAPGLDPVRQAARYIGYGAASLSVLTEEDHFKGSLADLMAVKDAFPQAAVLRKDFLLDVEDVRLSYRAGADAVLLIAAMLDDVSLEAMYRAARELGMQVLVEVHTREEVRRIAPLAPPLVGINARNLETFAIDPLLPLDVRHEIDWTAQVVYESGIFGREEAFFATSSGFNGLLVGESVVRNAEIIPRLINGMYFGQCARNGFWNRLVEARHNRRRPLVKICGITNHQDAIRADALGADLLGFVFAPSPRRADAAMVADMPRTGALRIGVVVLEKGQRELPADVRRLLEKGQLDAIQFSGDEDPDTCIDMAYPYYKTIRPQNADEAGQALANLHCPRVLLDAYSASARGGTGKRAPDEVVAAVEAKRPLWLAGGLGPDNVAPLIKQYRPELVDASSRLEASPGIKDPELLARYMTEVNREFGV